MTIVTPLICPRMSKKGELVSLNLDAPEENSLVITCPSFSVSLQIGASFGKFAGMVH